MKNTIFCFFTWLVVCTTNAQQKNYWQQHVSYKMDVKVDAVNYQYAGSQQLVYTNNSPDVLYKVYYHLYFNAFQPGSEMDIRIQNIADPDARVVTDQVTFQSKIAKLKNNEVGYLQIKSLQQNGVPVAYKVSGTVLEVRLQKPIKPGKKAVFDMQFQGQVPVMVRRAGRNSTDGVAFSMAQWYPKMAAYDFEGWHADPYIGREFYGEWGNYDVKLQIDKKYTVAGTGVLQNPHKIGHGYASSKKQKLSKKQYNQWHFKAKNVHDFSWAADTNYIHDIVPIENGPTLHFFYKNDPKYIENWKKIQPKSVESMQILSRRLGKYPWSQYAIIQAGDGGMEYAMCTFVAGGENLNGLLNTVVHEMAHAWFQQLLATNEAKHAWMDEGFTSYISTLVGNELSKISRVNPFKGASNGYLYVVKEKLEEPLTTHADHFNTNVAYAVGAYVKGKLFLSQLGYIIGEKNLEKTLKAYVETFKFKHPTPNDFLQIAEKTSKIHLGWYLNEWIQTTHTIDYKVKAVNTTHIVLERLGAMPMPIDLTVEYLDGSSEEFYIPLRMMHGKKPTKATILNDWPWVQPTYSIDTQKQIAKVTIDPHKKMAETNQENNTISSK